MTKLQQAIELLQQADQEICDKMNKMPYRDTIPLQQQSNRLYTALTILQDTFVQADDIPK